MSNFLVFFVPILNMKLDGILDVFQCFFVSIALRVTTLKFRTKSKVTIFVVFYYNRKIKVFHNAIIAYITKRTRILILGSVPILFVFVCVRVIWVGDKFLER